MVHISSLSSAPQAPQVSLTKVRFTEWAAKYGGIFSLKLGPANAIVVTDRAIIKALIDKKSAIYSNRPRSYVSHDLMTKGDHLLVMQHGEKWRLFRKLLHQTFQERKCETEHIVLQDAEAVQMCRDFLIEPEGLNGHPKRFSNSIVMSIRRLIPYDIVSFIV